MPLRSRLGPNKGPDIFPTPVPVGPYRTLSSILDGVERGNELKGEKPNIYYLFELVYCSVLD